MADLSENRFRILEALCKQEGRTITREQFLEHFYFSAPERAPGALPRKNTRIKLVPKTDSGFFGMKTIWYNRIHTKSLGLMPVTRTTENSIHDLIPQVNDRYGLQLNEYDLVNFDLAPNQVGNFVFVPPINQTSLMFYDGDYIPTTSENDVEPPPLIYPYGTLVKNICDGFVRKGIFSDGHGGTFMQVLETECVHCGYDPDQIILLDIDGGSSTEIYVEPWQWMGGGDAFVV